jgi:hypothetical protein
MSDELGLAILVCLGTIRAVLRSALPCWSRGAAIPASLRVSHADYPVYELGTTRDPKTAARDEPFIDELIWYAQALASPRGRFGGSCSP